MGWRVGEGRGYARSLPGGRHTSGRPYCAAQGIAGSSTLSFQLNDYQNIFPSDLLKLTEFLIDIADYNSAVFFPAPFLIL